MDYISTTPLYDSNYLAHYGIKGQKWGVRRFQNSDGTLTAEGVKRYGSVKEMKKAVRKEYKADNKAAKEAGATATSMRIASEIQDRVADRAVKRANKKPSSERLKRKANLEAAAAIQLRMLNGESERVAREHYKSLVEKYGKNAISDIKTKKMEE